MEPKYHMEFFDVDIPITNRNVFNKEPIKHFLKKYFTWVLDVTGIEIPSQIANVNQTIQISIVVSPTHYSEISTNYHVENLVKNKLSEKIKRHLVAMYSEVEANCHIRFLFFPEKSKTLLEELK